MMEFLTAPRPIRTVLIANRGEIACRIMRTCHRLGIATIAVHSEADTEAPHVCLATQAICIGPAASAQSYLNVPALIEAAKAGGADAVHPGYGFLSENADFVRACEDVGLIFVGPSSDAVAGMGSKVNARRLAKEAGVATVPGFEDSDADFDTLAKAAEKLGYPVMIKANSGGGGRGMRRVAAHDGLKDAIASARTEAGASFGDDAIFIEKLIEAPRHLEVQVFGDGAGGALHFYERDCSVQRNHQKVIEEAPAPNLPAPVRAALIEDALKLTRSINYSGAGTVEFIMGTGGDTPYFLEMNTRLQVEHPVTEEICGVDLVEFQLRLAAGLTLPLTQNHIVPKGHSIEVRINAEQANSDFMPSTGVFFEVGAPAGLRFETGVATGSQVGTHYDSMLAKLISYGPDRDTARLRLIDGLERLRMIGVSTNQPFLIDCLRGELFAKGQMTTGFLEHTFEGGWQPDMQHLTRLRAAAVLAFANDAGDDPRLRTDGFRVLRDRRAARASFVVEDQYGAAELTLWTGSRQTVEADGQTYDMSGFEADILRVGDTIHAFRNGLGIAATVMNGAEAKLEHGGGSLSEGHVAAPLTGLITKMLVAANDTVTKGTPMIEMEAMKLVHTLKAPFDGTVEKVSCAQGDTVQAKTTLIVMKETE